jgi:DNA-binding response OmpR family regulator
VAPAAEPGRILIVDDEPEIGAMLSDLLTLKGYSARAVPDGGAAVREIVAAPPDVVLLDINMPGLTGIDALPTIRAVAPRVVVIMISATEDPRPRSGRLRTVPSTTWSSRSTTRT